jgi:ADP-ribose pyrophosphatase
MDNNLEWKKKGEKLIYDGYRKIIERTFVFPNGKERSFELRKEGESSGVVALTENDEVILVKQFRPGPEKVWLDIPGGGVEIGETPLAAIKRELLEETGYEGKVSFVQTFSSGAYSTGIKHCFVATGCRRVKDPTPDEGEFMEVNLMLLADFRDHLRSGQLSDIHMGYLALDHLGLL